MILPGQYFDTETELNYNYFRDYDPSTGRYIESDPIRLGGGPNTYAYVGSNPLSYIDLFGLTQCDIDTAVVIVRSYYLALNMGEGPPVVDPPVLGPLSPPRDHAYANSRNQGYSFYIPDRDDLIHLNPRFLDCLSDDEATYLLEAILHESLHFTRPSILQGPRKFDHDFIKPEGQKMTSAIRAVFLRAREKCKCCKQ